MGMSMYAGKSVRYVSKDDAIHPMTKVTYRDQNGNEININIKEMLKLAKKSKTAKFKMLISDIEGGGLHIGFPIIIAMNDLAEEFGDKIVFDKVVLEAKKETKCGGKEE